MHKEFLGVERTWQTKQQEPQQQPHLQLPRRRATSAATADLVQQGALVAARAATRNISAARRFANSASRRSMRSTIRTWACFASSWLSAARSFRDACPEFALRTSVA